MSVSAPGPEWILSGSSHASAENHELLDCARRAWPRVLAYARRQTPVHVSPDETDSLAAEVWEAVLRSVSKTLGRTKRARRKILDLEAYLVGAFQHRFNRQLKKEKRRQRTIELMPLQQLENLPENEGGPWGTGLERDLQIQQIVARMDDWTRQAWAGRQYGYSWREIARLFGMNEQQAKMRFRYAIEKIRKSIMGSSTDGDRRSDSGGEV